MPRLAKGGKWVFGWVTVSDTGAIRIPPEAVAWYGFQPGERAIFLRGSVTSGGLAISTERLWPADFGNPACCNRVIGQGVIEIDYLVALPPVAGAEPGTRLLAAFGSGNALGLLAHGPIYELAETHTELVCFCCQTE